MKKKSFIIISIFLIAIILMANFSYGIFTPHIYESEDKKVIAYAELNAVTITLPSGKRIQSTNINGDTQMDIQTITAPIEVVLIIDTSGSMAASISEEDDTTRMDEAKRSAISFVENLFNLAGDNIKVSVISFTNKSKVRISRSSDKDAIEESINELYAGGSTNILPAIENAESIIASARQENDNIYPVIVNLTDGATSKANESYKKLLKMQEDNIGIYNVLLECNYKTAFSQNGVDAGVIYENISSEELTEIYDEIYDLICSEVVDNTVTKFIENAQNYFITNDDLYMYLDPEMSQGSKLELEYIINIKTAIPCTKLELQDEIDKKLNFDISSKMISEDKTNEDYGWQINENLSHKDGHNLVLSLCEKSEDDSEYVIKKGKAYQTKLLLSCLLTNKEDANYKNTLTFRINGEQELTKSLNSMEVNITPPFGEDKSRTIIWILLLVSILILIYIIFHIKRQKG